MTTLVPTMGPTSRSLTSMIQLRREAKWADVVVLSDVIPWAMLRMGRRFLGSTPVIIRVSEFDKDAGPDAKGLLAKAVRLIGSSDRGGLLGVITPDPALRIWLSSELEQSLPVFVVSTPLSRDLENSAHLERARRSARSQLGLRADDVAIVDFDLSTGAVRPTGDDASTAAINGVDDPVSCADLADGANAMLQDLGEPTRRMVSLRLAEGHTAALEWKRNVIQTTDAQLAIHASDLALIHGEVCVGSVGLVDLMATGVIPVVGLIHAADGAADSAADKVADKAADSATVGESVPEPGLVVDGLNAVAIPLGGRSISEAARRLANLIAEPGRIDELSVEARRTAMATSSSQESHAQWLRCLLKALPSLP